MRVTCAYPERVGVVPPKKSLDEYLESLKARDDINVWTGDDPEGRGVTCVVWLSYASGRLCAAYEIEED